MLYNCKRILRKKIVSKNVINRHFSKYDGKLILEDGSEFRGKMFGSKQSVNGEVVFSTNMVGYPESMTDPSFKGQIINLTYPMIGNYGIPPIVNDEQGINKYLESHKIWCNGLLIQDYSHFFNHWNAEKSLSDWMEEYDIPGLYGIDTREITTRIRNKGSMLGKIVYDGNDIPLENINKENLVKLVSTKEVKTFGDGNIKIVAIDCGIKNNILRFLIDRGAKVTLVPYDYDFTQLDYDGLFISNGPGDPSMCTETINHIKKSLEGDKPII